MCTRAYVVRITNYCVYKCAVICINTQNETITSDMKNLQREFSDHKSTSPMYYNVSFCS